MHVLQVLNVASLGKPSLGATLVKHRLLGLRPQELAGVLSKPRERLHNIDTAPKLRQPSRAKVVATRAEARVDEQGVDVALT